MSSGEVEPIWPWTARLCQVFNAPINPVGQSHFFVAIQFAEQRGGAFRNDKAVSDRNRVPVPDNHEKGVLGKDLRTLNRSKSRHTQGERRISFT